MRLKRRIYSFCTIEGKDLKRDFLQGDAAPQTISDGTKRALRAFSFSHILIDLPILYIPGDVLLYMPLFSGLRT